MILRLGVRREESFHCAAKCAYYLLEEASLVILALELFVSVTNSRISCQVLTFVEHAVKTLPVLSLQLVV